MHDEPRRRVECVFHDMAVWRQTPPTLSNTNTMSHMNSQTITMNSECLCVWKVEWTRVVFFFNEQFVERKYGFHWCIILFMLFNLTTTSVFPQHWQHLLVTVIIFNCYCYFPTISSMHIGIRRLYRMRKMSFGRRIAGGAFSCDPKAAPAMYDNPYLLLWVCAVWRLLAAWICIIESFRLAHFPSA